MKSLTFSTTANSPTSALCNFDPNNSTIAPATRPEFMIGAAYPLTLALVEEDDNGNYDYDSRSGSASYTVKVGIGIPGALPTSGTFKLNWNGVNTTALNYNCTAAEIQTALNVPLIGNGHFIVTGTLPVFLVYFGGTLSGVPQPLINVVPGALLTELSPPSAVTVSEVVVGSTPSGGAVDEVQAILIALQPRVLQSTWTSGSNAWTGTLQINTADIIALLPTGSASTPATLEVSIYDGSNNKIPCGLTACTILNRVIDEESVGQNGIQGMRSGRTAITNGNDFVLVTGAAFASVPVVVTGSVIKPTGGLNIHPTFDLSTFTTGGFRADLSGMTDATGYYLAWFATF